MRGPYLITALPEDLSGLTIEMAFALHRAAAVHGRPRGPGLNILMVKTPLLVCITATTEPGKRRINVTRLPGMIVAGQAAMIFLSADGGNYLVLDTTIDIEELRQIADDLGGDPVA